PCGRAARNVLRICRRAAPDAEETAERGTRTGLKTARHLKYCRSTLFLPLLFLGVGFAAPGMLSKVGRSGLTRLAHQPSSSRSTVVNASAMTSCVRWLGCQSQP